MRRIAKLDFMTKETVVWALQKRWDKQKATFLLVNCKPIYSSTAVFIANQFRWLMLFSFWYIYRMGSGTRVIPQLLHLQRQMENEKNCSEVTFRLLIKYDYGECH